MDEKTAKCPLEQFSQAALITCLKNMYHKLSRSSAILIIAN